MARETVRCARPGAKLTYPTGELFGAYVLGVPAALATAWAGVRAGFSVTPLDGRAGYVDGLRGFLAAAVLFHHFSFWIGVEVMHQGWARPHIPFVNNLGKGGVSVFFMITGLLLYSRVVAKGVDQVDWLRFWTLRAFRILPLTIIVTAIAASVSGYRMGGAHGLLSPGTLRSLLAWVSGYDEPPLFGYADSRHLNAGVMWSLGYEWFFYSVVLLTLSSATWVLRRWMVPPVAVPLGFCLLMLAWRLARPEADRPAFFMLFALGMLVADARERSDVRRWLSGRFAAAIVLVAVFAAMATSQAPYGPALMAGYALLLLTVSSGNSLFGVLATRPARALGDASFSIYMLHGLVLSAFMPVLAARTAPQPAWWLPLIAAMVVALSMASYVAIETPMNRLGKRLAHWPQRDRSLPVEVAP